MLKRSKLPKPRKGAWFVPLRASYLPVTWQGWLTYIPYLYYLFITFTAINHHTHSVSDLVINLIPYWVSGAVIMTWIAKRKS